MAKKTPSTQLTPKQETFCQGVASGMTQSDAFRKAYDASRMKPDSVQVNASKLMADARIRLRVEELRKPVVEKLRYNLEQAMREAEEAFEVARKKGNGGAMVAAVTLRSKLNGLLVERQEVKVSPIQTMDDAELDRIIATKAKEAGVSVH